MKCESKILKTPLKSKCENILVVKNLKKYFPVATNFLESQLNGYMLLKMYHLL